MTSQAGLVSASRTESKRKSEGNFFRTLRFDRLTLCLLFPRKPCPTLYRQKGCRWKYFHTPDSTVALSRANYEVRVLTFTMETDRKRVSPIETKFVLSAQHFLFLSTRKLNKTLFLIKDWKEHMSYGSASG